MISRILFAITILAAFAPSGYGQDRTGYADPAEARGAQLTQVYGAGGSFGTVR